MLEAVFLCHTQLNLYSSESAPYKPERHWKKRIIFYLNLLTILSWFYSHLSGFSTADYFLLSLKCAYRKGSNPSSSQRPHLCSVSAVASMQMTPKANLCCEFWLHFKLLMNSSWTSPLKCLILSLRNHSLSLFFLLISSQTPNLEHASTYYSVSVQFIQCYHQVQLSTFAAILTKFFSDSRLTTECGKMFLSPNILQTQPNISSSVPTDPEGPLSYSV